MKSQVLSKMNNFVKNRLMECYGFFLIFVSFFFYLQLLPTPQATRISSIHRKTQKLKILVDFMVALFLTFYFSL